MKAITLYEPFASLVAIGAKINETRPNRTAIRGDICIHAAKKSGYDISLDFANLVASAFSSRGETASKNSFGCILAVVEIWDVQPSEKFFPEAWLIRPPGCESRAAVSGGIATSKEEFLFGNYAPGRWIYRTRNLRRLKTPVPCRGFQCVGWTVPEDVEAKVRAQL